MKIAVDVVVRGTLMGKSIEAVRGLLEEMTSNSYHWPSERATPKRSGGKYDIDAVTVLAIKVVALTQRLDKVSTFPNP